MQSQRTWTATRRLSSSVTRGVKQHARCATKESASGVRTASYSGLMGPVIATPFRLLGAAILVFCCCSWVGQPPAGQQQSALVACAGRPPLGHAVAVS